MQFPAIPGWGLLPVFVGGLSAILAEVPAGSSPPFLAGVCSCWVKVVGPRQTWLRALGAVPRHSWLGSAASVG